MTSSVHTKDHSRDVSRKDCHLFFLAFPLLILGIQYFWMIPWRSTHSIPLTLLYPRPFSQMAHKSTSAALSPPSCLQSLATATSISDPLCYDTKSESSARVPSPSTTLSRNDNEEESADNDVSIWEDDELVEGGELWNYLEELAAYSGPSHEFISRRPYQYVVSPTKCS